MKTIIERARDYAEVAHREQRRKYTNEPYFSHLHNVAMLCQEARLPDIAIAAAYLHDCLEDTSTTYENLREIFGTDIANLVREVTDVSKPEDGNRAVRKALDRDALAQASSLAQSIKLADTIDNTSSICLYDPKFAEVYMKEKIALVPLLLYGNAWLLNIAKQVIKDYVERNHT